MRYARVVPWLTEPELCRWMRAAASRMEHERRLAIWMACLRYRVGEIAQILGVSRPSIWRWLNTYNQQGPTGLQSRGWGGRRRGCLSVEEEQALVKVLAKEGRQGRRPTAKELRQRVSRHVGREVSLSYIYGLLRRHGRPIRRGAIPAEGTSSPPSVTST